MPNWLRSFVVLLAVTALLIAVMLLIAVSAAAAIAVLAVSGLVWLLVIVLGRSSRVGGEYRNL